MTEEHCNKTLNCKIGKLKENARPLYKISNITSLTSIEEIGAAEVLQICNVICNHSNCYQSCFLQHHCPYKKGSDYSQTINLILQWKNNININDIVIIDGVIKNKAVITYIDESTSVATFLLSNGKTADIHQSRLIRTGETVALDKLLNSIKSLEE